MENGCNVFSPVGFENNNKVNTGLWKLTSSDDAYELGILWILGILGILEILEILGNNKARALAATYNECMYTTWDHEMQQWMNMYMLSIPLVLWKYKLSLKFNVFQYLVKI